MLLAEECCRQPITMSHASAFGPIFVAAAAAAAASKLLQIGALVVATSAAGNEVQFVLVCVAFEICRN